ncbi:TPA: type II toxin-antitoxin system MqsR family toxin [Vibrio vulnificus]|uniref:Type II toxin-antitoxin system MqsR family toxin n=1 Tax=Vibrio vulnificus TaxID=672 RepID=A0A8H9N526_VIBVL|nr:type II toxin-antitoxin system MqsR family toxin [Vibrio cholerae]HAS8542898.1 type II toxin-antitoxin system MqsR family toxin [Vibrio vulnificus]
MGVVVAEYSLEDVKRAAQQLNIEYRGRKVYRDAANLGYEIQDVADCLCRLTERDFKKTHYREVGLPDDEYICRYTKVVDDEERVDELYVKFCLIEDCLVVDLASFHLPQY